MIYNTRDNIERAAQAIREDSVGFTTGYPDLDKITCGLKPGEVTVIGGWPGMGKSALMGNIVSRSAVQLPQLVFSQEMSVRTLMARMLMDVGQLPAFRLREGDLSDDEQKRKDVAITKLKNRPIFIDGSTKITPKMVDEQCQHITENVAEQFVVHIDYLQMMKPNSTTGSKRTDVDSILEDLCEIAKKRNIPIVLLCQLKRPDEQKYGREPRLSDLKESSGIEQFASQVVLIHRPAYYQMTTINASATDNGEAYLIVAKNRHGSQGKVPLLWLAEFTSFQSMDVGDEDTDNLYKAPDEPVMDEGPAPSEMADQFAQDYSLPAEEAQQGIEPALDGTDPNDPAPGEQTDFLDDLTPPEVDEDIPF